MSWKVSNEMSTSTEINFVKEHFSSKTLLIWIYSLLIWIYSLLWSLELIIQEYKYSFANNINKNILLLISQVSEHNE